MSLYTSLQFAPVALLTRAAPTPGSSNNTSQRRASPSSEEDESESESSEEEYGASMSKKSKKRKPTHSKRSVSQFEMPRVSSRNGKQLPNYNEAAVDWDLSESDDGYDYAAPTDEKGESSSLFLCEREAELIFHLQGERMPSTASTTTSETASMVSLAPSLCYPSRSLTSCHRGRREGRADAQPPLPRQMAGLLPHPQHLGDVRVPQALQGIQEGRELHQGRLGRTATHFERPFDFARRPRGARD